MYAWAHECVTASRGPHRFVQKYDVLFYSDFTFLDILTFTFIYNTPPGAKLGPL